MVTDRVTSNKKKNRQCAVDIRSQRRSVRWLSSRRVRMTTPHRPFDFSNGAQRSFIHKSLLREGVCHPRLDRLAAIAPEREPHVSAASERLQMVAHNVVVVACTLCLECRDRCRICEHRVRTNGEQRGPHCGISLHSCGAAADPAAPREAHYRQRYCATSRAPQGVSPFLLHV